MNDQHLPVSYDLQAIESDAEIVGFEKADMTLLQSCILNGEISDYEQMATENQMVIGRPMTLRNILVFVQKSARRCP